MIFKQKLIEINARGTAKICFEPNEKNRIQCNGANTPGSTMVYIVYRKSDIGNEHKYRLVNAESLQEFTPERWNAWRKLMDEKGMFNAYCNACATALRNGMIPESLR